MSCYCILTVFSILKRSKKIACRYLLHLYGNKVLEMCEDGFKQKVKSYVRNPLFNVILRIFM